MGRDEPAVPYVNAEIGPFTIEQGAFCEGVRFASSVKGSPDQIDANTAQHHAYNGRVAHQESPDSSYPLRYKVLLGAFILAGFVACLGNAIRLTMKGKERQASRAGYSVRLEYSLWFW
jgi:hypothetical protein